MIVYTCITNGYDEIPDNHYYSPDVQYVCFTDGTITHKGPWEFIDIPFDHECPRRKSAYPKINPHKLFPKGSKVVWLDGCYQMTEEFVEISKKNLDDHPFTIMRHECKFTYLDEVLEGFMASMNTWEDVLDITKKLKHEGYEFKKYCSPVLGCIWRQVGNNEFHDLWWKYSLIGPNRDQVSFDAARQFTHLDLNIIEDGWTGGVGMKFGTRNKVSRKKLHPQSGHDKQYLEREKILKELYTITGLHPKLYARYDHMPFVYRNVIEPYLPKS